MKDFGFTIVSDLGANIKQNGYDGGTSFTSKAIPGDGQLHRSNGLHTIMVSTDNFTGNIILQASIEKTPENFSNISLTNIVDGSTVEKLIFNDDSVHNIYQIIGSYYWLRIKVDNIVTNTVFLNNSNMNGTDQGTLNFFKVAF